MQSCRSLDAQRDRIIFFIYSARTLRGNGTLITHNTACIVRVLWMHSHYYIPVWGDFWQFDPKVGYFQNIRSAMMASSKSPYNKGSVPLSPHTQDSILPYWVQYNTDFKRQKKIKYFSMVRISLSQKHREYYKDKTGTVQPVNLCHASENNYFTLSFK
uniref:Uncharacterized protein n=1 Tax=Cyprinus carpio TaxID=7962 RepID=A0A8C1TNX5_CYPCA